MEKEIKNEGIFKYVEQGDGPVIILLHGLFGALSNFNPLYDYFVNSYKVVTPILPLYDLPVRETNIENLVQYVKAFISYKGYQNITLMGNSLGGHVALLYAAEDQSQLNSMVLTGSSGLFESALGDTFPRRKDYDYIKAKTEYTFYDPNVASKELVDEVYEIVNSREKGLRVISMAKSAIHNNMAEELQHIKIPSLLIWGIQDKITPAFVGEEFHQKLPNSELHMIDECGHAPMMEKPEEFNAILEVFLKQQHTS